MSLHGIRGFARCRGIVEARRVGVRIGIVRHGKGQSILLLLLRDEIYF